ncbi:hypothetical protein BKA69DRAFT_1107545, partial [Paraphysoderma sedebokerense]
MILPKPQTPQHHADKLQPVNHTEFQFYNSILAADFEKIICNRLSLNGNVTFQKDSISVAGCDHGLPAGQNPSAEYLPFAAYFPFYHNPMNELVWIFGRELVGSVVQRVSLSWSHQISSSAGLEKELQYTFNRQLDFSLKEGFQFQLFPANQLNTANPDGNTYIISESYQTYSYTVSDFITNMAGYISFILVMYTFLFGDFRLDPFGIVQRYIIGIPNEFKNLEDQIRKANVTTEMVQTDLKNETVMVGPQYTESGMVQYYYPQQQNFSSPSTVESTLDILGRYYIRV